MSFDLGVWCEAEPVTTTAAGAKYQRLCEQDMTGLVADERVTAFYEALTAVYPEIDALAESDVDGCPWSCAIDRSAGHVIVAIVWSRAADVGGVVRDLAAGHGLVCFDPQAGVVHHPPRSAVSGVLRLELCDGSIVEGPDVATIRRELGRLSVQNWYAVLEGPPECYVQVGMGQDAAVLPGQYGLEHRDGSPQRHYRCVVASLNDVVTAFEGFAGGDHGWKQRFRWERVDL